MNQLKVIEQNNQRVLTTAQLAESYGASSEKVSYNFNYNKSRYTEGKHFIAITGDEKREFVNRHEIQDGAKNAKTLYLWTEKGAWLHAKSLNTDEAWDAYEKLVDEYYKLAEEKKSMTPAELALLQAQNLYQLESRVDQHQSKLETIEKKVDEQITLDHGEQRRLQRLISSKVFEHAKTDDHKRLLYPELHREIKDRFGVASYKDVKRHELQSAIRYVESWIPRKVS
jgi:hypothetical protein